MRIDRIFTLILALWAWAQVQAQAPQAEILLPDGGLCQHAGFGATLAFGGDRLNYSCAEEAGLVGELRLQGDALQVDRVQLDMQASPIALLERRTVAGTVGRVVLADGTVCLSTGHGATLAFEGRRLNYACGDGEQGLIGDMREEGGRVFATRVTLHRGQDGPLAREEGEVVVALLDARLPITARAWRLRAMGEGDTLQPAVEGAEPTLGLRAGGVNGSAGCNSYFGSVLLGQDGAIRFGEMGSTLMACPEPRMEQEFRFLTALQQVRFYFIGEGGELRMFGRETLVFEPISDDPAQ